MKISVYGIAKNERKFVERFMNSAQDADEIVVVDTGSHDGTARILEDMGARVHHASVRPWRFDVARNVSLSLVDPDADLCICMDLDEVLTEDWRLRVERAWLDTRFTRGTYRFDWGSGVYFDSDKMHARHGYVWHHPCHEILMPDRITEVKQHIPGDEPLIVHLPDAGKSRSQYLELLEVAVNEAPHSVRTAFYYARELYFAGRHRAALGALTTYLAMPDATWKAERAYAMRVMAKCHGVLGDTASQLQWIYRAIAEECTARCGWVDLAEYHYHQQSWKACLAAAEKVLSIREREPNYTVDPRSWGYLPYDFAAIAAFKLNHPVKAANFGTKALANVGEHHPDRERLANNMTFYRGDKPKTCASEANEGNLKATATA